MIGKKFVFLLLLIISLILTTGLVSASTVDMAGIKFNIPESYGELENVSINGEVDEETQVITYCKGYTGGLEDMIVIAVSYSIEDDSKFTLDEALNELGGPYTKKTINGHEGGFIQEEGNSTFTYVEDNKIVMIMSNNENLITQVIV